MASFHLIVPPTLGTIYLVWNCGQVGERGLVAFQAVTHALRPAGNIDDGQGTLWNYPAHANMCGGCSTIELGRRLAPAIGVEPITCDNPQLRPIENHERTRERLWNCPECYRYTTAECSVERN